MATILATKLYIPSPRPQVVVRSGLIERLNKSLRHKVILISAPAGFGKTTLVSEWVASDRRQTAWLSLDEGDSDLARFLTYIVAALRTITADIGEAVLNMLQPPQLASNEAVLTTLLNEITAIPDHFVLVLDDYHTIESPSVDQALAFLIEHLPSHMHLIIATREDPQLPLARLRARDQLVELRVADLRFTPAEAAEFFDQVMGLSLSTDHIEALETRTEGWIAGLQLAALSLQRRPDAASLIESFTGSHHFVLDYLLEEVLFRQPETIQMFLLWTSILDRLCGSLCDAVMGSPAGGQTTLEYLERANLFIVPLDNQRHWYRYHHLFGDLLRQRLHQHAAVPAEDVSTLHDRASRWYETNGYQAEAFQHAIAAKDFERAAGLAELAWQSMDSSFQFATWLGWVKALPDEQIRNRPVLSTQLAQSLMDTGELEAGKSRLRDAERWLDAVGESVEQLPAGMVITDLEQFRTLPFRIALTRAYAAQSQGDIPGTLQYAEQALKFTPEEDYSGRGAVAALLGSAYWARGDLESAYKALADFAASMLKVGNIYFFVASTFVRVEIKIAQGCLREAIQICKQSLHLAHEHDSHIQRVTSHLYLELAMLYHEMGDREAAVQYLQKSEETGKQTALIDWPCRWALARARLKESAGDLDAALDLLDEAERLYVQVPLPDLRPIPAMRARVWIKQGRLTHALTWVHEQGLSVHDELSYLHEFEHMTLARVLIATYQCNPTEHSLLETVELLARLLKAAEDGKRIGSVIEILLLQAHAYEAQDNLPLALASLNRALVLAEAEGYVQIFVDEGQPIAALLAQVKAENSRIEAYVQRLLAAFRKHENALSEDLTIASQPLLEPLSERELEILGLIAQGLSNQEISERLFLALSTVKGHNLRIFGKLQVQRRTEAVARARELGLL